MAAPSLGAEPPHSPRRGGSGATINRLRLWQRQSLIVAHELFHCVNVYHHGDIDMVAAWSVVVDEATQKKSLIELREDGRRTAIHVLEENGVDITTKEIARISKLNGAEWLFKMGVDNGQHSGDDACVMRYANSEAYDSKYDSAARYITKERPGTGLCQSPAGFGVNDSSRDPQSRYGDAADLRGNCRDQVLVTDAVDAPSRCCPAPAGCSCP